MPKITKTDSSVEEKTKKVEKKVKKVVAKKEKSSTAVVKTEKKAATKKTDKDNFSRAVGRRKTAAARVRVFRGTGKIVINGVDIKEYIPYFEWQEEIISPLKSIGKEKELDVSAKVVGGGKRGQAIAVRHGIARALVVWNEEFKKSLKDLGVLTRDPRKKERKKPGLKKARRAPQWKKR